MAWIGETSGDGGELGKRRKIEDSESEKSSFILRRCSFKSHEEVEINRALILGLTSPEEIEIRDKFGPQVGDTVDLLPLLFTDSRDFLVKFNGQKVTFDNLNGKTIVLFMLSLANCCWGTGRGMMDMVDSYNELRVHDGVEFVFVPKHSSCFYPKRRGLFWSEEECFDFLFSKMPWPAVPCSDELKCRRIETVFWPSFPMLENAPYYVILDPKGKVLLTNTYRHRKPDPPIFHLYGGADLFSLPDLSLQSLQEKDEGMLDKLDLDQLLASPYRDFLLARDGTKVSISSLRDKVVGLYFCDNIQGLRTPPHMGALKKVYREAMGMGYDFEIVQINFHFRNNYELFPHDREMPLHVRCEDIPWLTLPFRDICCRRLRRLFKWHENFHYWRGESLVIIDPHRPNVDGTHFERFAKDIVKNYGIEAYPFTRRRVFEMEHEKMRKVKLHTIFPSGGPPLIRPSRRGFDQVPRSELFGKRVLVLFAQHSKFMQGRFESMLKSKYTSQPDEDGFEVVYVSCDRDESTFDEVIKEVPWLVHPYSWDFSQRWRSEFASCPPEDLLVAFDANGELLMCQPNLNVNYYYTADRRLSLFDSYPFVHVDMIGFILQNAAKKYSLDDRVNFPYAELPLCHIFYY